MIDTNKKQNRNPSIIVTKENPPLYDMTLMSSLTVSITDHEHVKPVGAVRHQAGQPVLAAAQQGAGCAGVHRAVRRQPRPLAGRRTELVRRPGV